MAALPSFARSFWRGIGIDWEWLVCEKTYSANRYSVPVFGSSVPVFCCVLLMLNKIIYDIHALRFDLIKNFVFYDFALTHSCQRAELI